MKKLALDTGDQWTGTALSDESGIFARPHKTTASKDLLPFLQNLFAQEKIDTVIVGYPKTMRGTESDQTKKVIALKEELEKLFPSYTWLLWDERLSSKRAASLKNARTKEEKLHAHSVAAAFILESYLTFFALQNSDE